MLGVAFDFGRTPHMALDQDRLRDAGQRNGARKKQRTARDEVLGLLDVRDDLLGRLLGARADAGERERRAHELQELAPAFRVVPLGGLLGELPVQVLAELERVGQLAEAAPVHAAVGAGETGSDSRRIHAQFSFQLPASSFAVPLPLAELRHSKLVAGSWQLELTDGTSSSSSAVRRPRSCIPGPDARRNPGRRPGAPTPC